MPIVTTRAQSDQHANKRLGKHTNHASQQRPRSRFHGKRQKFLGGSRPRKPTPGPACRRRLHQKLLRRRAESGRRHVEERVRWLFATSECAGASSVRVKADVDVVILDFRWKDALGDIGDQL